MIRAIAPLVRPPRTRVRVPGSKSITNRALVCAALADGVSTIRNPSDSEDSALMVNALDQLGVFTQRGTGVWRVHGTGGRLHAPKFPIPAGNAGTTLRFLLSVAAVAPGTTVFEADGRMGERPHAPLLEALRALGAEAAQEGPAARFSVRGGPVPGGSVRLQADRSSQFLSSLLLAAAAMPKGIHVDAEGEFVSAPYVRMTIHVMRAFGVDVRSGGAGFTVHPGSRYRPAEFAIEPDASGASYFFAAAALAGGEVEVAGVREGSLQGDAAFVRILKRMGAAVSPTPDGLAVRGAPLRGVEADMREMPDVAPTLAVTALFADGRTVIRNVAHLRFKESDRLAALAGELAKLGAGVRTGEDSLVIEPRPLHGALLDTFEDHRLAMSFALAGLKVPGVGIENPDCVRKSFPGFWKEFESLYL
jgi:3-phosphoshikimate 1-carboxyvinyltransferase